ncbi:MAG TPA: hypothetical protein VHZ03_46580 [Trebonia sp.]|nr:hypothetical protein [Trebonia sp.]
MLCAAAQSLSFSPGGAGAPARIDRDVQQIVAGQAALLRVATLVARGVCHEELFAVVNQELAQLPGADAAALLRFEPDETITLLAAWNPAGAPAPAGEREPVNAALRRLRDTARPIAVRADGRPAHRTIHRRDPAPRDPRVGGSTDPGRRPRMGDQRGRIAEPGAVPPATETRIAEFTELVATAISNGTPAPSWRPPARAIAAADEFGPGGELRTLTSNGSACQTPSTAPTCSSQPHAPFAAAETRFRTKAQRGSDRYGMVPGESASRPLAKSKGAAR